MLRAFFKKEEGQGLVEYALILVLISVVVIGTLIGIGDRANAIFDSILQGLNGVSP